MGALVDAHVDGCGGAQRSDDRRMTILVVLANGNDPHIDVMRAHEGREHGTHALIEPRDAELWPVHAKFRMVVGPQSCLA